MNKELFTRLGECIRAVNATNKKTLKKEALSQFADVATLLRFTYDIFMPFRVTSTAVLNQPDLAPSWKYADLPIYDLLTDLTTGVISGHTGIASIKGVVASYPEFEDLIYMIIDKDLKLGCNVNTINSVFENLIPTFEVSLGYPYKDHQDKVTFDGLWLGSHKLDGIRCTCIVTDGVVKFYTRKGHEILTLDNLKPHILSMGAENAVFDGELCIVDENDVEDFRAISKLWNKKNFSIPQPSYKMFDMLTHEEFDSQTSTRILSERLTALAEIVPDHSQFLRMLKQVPLTLESFDELQAEFREKGWEGLILRKDVVYKGKRSNEILKMKDFTDGEFEVLSYEVAKYPKLFKGDGFQSIDGNIYESVEYDSDGDPHPAGNIIGQVSYVDGLKTVEISYKGNRVDVGSGFSLAEREEFFADPSAILGKVITVQWFEETQNDNGTLSLRFPTLKAIHGRDRDA